MKLAGSVTISATPEQVWHCLTDPDALSRCIPGCESLSQMGPDTYRATVRVGFAVLRGSYSGVVRMQEQQPVSQYRLVVEGAGRAGFVRGVAAMMLIPSGTSTRVQYDGTAEIGGLIAGIGQWMLARIARILIQRFFAGLEAEVKRTA